ncbi:hypothetical protein [Jeotgalibacillus aurantiacus]|uniref:hypothetical protein n=1 Tax=Jeotgalibacillus aurantiacus TaxID=2763266 RepID=UPI001D0B3329|nr:hypothetical protein [Jeotgalibacillus aurantiacus]
MNFYEYQVFSQTLETFKWPIVIILGILITIYRSKKEKEKERVISSERLLDHIVNDNVEGVKYCLKNDLCPVNPRTVSGESAVELAILKENKYILAYLIKYGAAVTAREVKVAHLVRNYEIIDLIKQGTYLEVILEYERGATA